ncbi:hypothetical protein GW17_00042241 [Ensete ventricosum]|nr:hypothetical protein GW17_00042241 [Ensete ventricosum]
MHSSMSHDSSLLKLPNQRAQSPASISRSTAAYVPLRLLVHRDKICSCKLRLAELIADHRNGGGFVTEFFTPLHSVLYQSYRDISVGVRHRFW